MSCAKVTAKIDELFVGELAGRDRKSVREHLATCPQCRAYYSRLSAVQRRLSPGEPLGRELLDGDELIARLGASPRRRWPWIFGAATAMAGVAVLVVSLRQPAMQERGGGTPPPATSVRAFCLSAPSEGRRDVADALALAPTPNAPILRCPIGGALQFAYHRVEGGPRYLFIVGRGADGRTLHYAPHGDEASSVAMQEDRAEAVLPDSTLLAPNHVIGRTEIVALLTDAPLAIADVDRAIGAGGVDAAAKHGTVALKLQLEVGP